MTAVGGLTDSAAFARELARLRVLVVGTGLIGTSVALALRRHGTQVMLSDRNPQRVTVAVHRGAGRPWCATEWSPAAGRHIEPVPSARSGHHDLPADLPVDLLVDDPIDQSDADEPVVDHVVLAVPPREVGSVLVAWQRRLPTATFSDTASVKVAPLTEARRLGADLSSMCGAHPVSGRERSGPEAAREDLFRGQPWVITPSAVTSARAQRHASLIATGCGANVIQLDPEAHDLALGLLSHLPHVIASAVAARLALIPDDVVKLAGPGLMDFTRIAGANADLWTDIVAANATPVAALLADLVSDLVRVRDALSAAPGGTIDQPVVESLFRLGNTGRLRLETARPATALGSPTAIPAPGPLPVAPNGVRAEHLDGLPPTPDDHHRPDLTGPVPIPTQPGVLAHPRGDVTIREDTQNGEHGSYGHARRELGHSVPVGREDDGWRR